MKKLAHIITVALIAAVMLPVLAACSVADILKENDPVSARDTAALVIVAGAHNNSETMPITSDSNGMLRQVLSNFGVVRVIVADGDPEIVTDSDGFPLGYCASSYIAESKQNKRDNEETWEQRYLTPQLIRLSNGIDSLEPDDPEVDTLAAVFEACDLLHSIATDAGGGDMKIVIYDTGLCTTGAMNFLQTDLLGLLYSEDKLDAESVDAFLDLLEAKAEIPDLSGIFVTWYGLGKVSGQQESLSRLNTENLRMIWGELLQRANAVPSDVNTDAEYGYFSYTTSHGATSYEQNVTSVIDWNQGCIKIFATMLGFVPDSDALKSEEDALAALKPYADNLNSYSDMQILLVGTTADPERHGGDKVLSEQRAIVVRELFGKLGVSESRFSVLGWGANAPFYDEREWNDGRFDHDIAETNRSVIIMPLQSELAQSLLTENSHNNIDA